MVVELGGNDIVVTLNEKVTIDSAEFVLIITSDQTSKKVACLLGEDLSLYPERSNKFSLTLKTSPDPLEAEVFLANTGGHKYFIYEYADASAFDFAGVDTLDLTTLDEPVESGIMDYVTTPEARKYYNKNRSSVKTYV